MGARRGLYRSQHGALRPLAHRHGGLGVGRPQERPARRGGGGGTLIVPSTARFGPSTIVTVFEVWFATKSVPPAVAATWYGSTPTGTVPTTFFSASNPATTAFKP